MVETGETIKVARCVWCRSEIVLIHWDYRGELWEHRGPPISEHCQGAPKATPVPESIRDIR